MKTNSKSKPDKKSIMIIGAGNVQIPLIEAAKRENYHTLVCDFNPKAPGVSLADEFCEVSTKDRFGLLSVAKDRHIDGIVANSEYAMCDAAYIANELGLVGNPENAVDIFSSKSGFRTFQNKEGLFAPAFLPDDKIEQLLTDDRSFPFPAVIKPDQNSGTRGVALVMDAYDRGAIDQAIRTARTISRNGKAIAEEYIPMPSQMVIEGEIFIHHGEILWEGLFHTVRSKTTPMIPMTYVFPLQETERKTMLLKEALIKAFRSAGIQHGEYNIEMFFTPDERPFLIEINPRQGGNDLPRYVQESCGIDFTRMLVTTAMGDDDYWDSLKGFKRQKVCITHHMLFPRKNGRFRGFQIAESLSDCIYRTHLDIRIGDEVEETVDGSSSIGYVDLRFSEPEEQMNVSNHLEEMIQQK